MHIVFASHYKVYFLLYFFSHKEPIIVVLLWYLKIFLISKITRIQLKHL